MNSPYILTLDIGSSSIRAMVYDSAARAVPDAIAQIKYQFRTTADGGVEMDADELLSHCFAATATALARFTEPIAAVASDCFTLSVLGVSGDGEPVTPIYTYADSRGAREVAELRAKFDERVAHQRVGAMFHTSYLPARLLWLVSHHAEEFKRAKYWMSFGEFLYFKLLGVRAVSYSIASWTGLLNRTTMDWDEELIAELPISKEQLSPIANDQLPITNNRWSALKDAAWFSTIGDGAAANLGSGCVDASRVAMTIGTSSAVRVATPIPIPPLSSASEAIVPRQRQERELPFGLWGYRIEKDLELIGGALNEGGNVYSWMVDTLTGRPTEEELAQLEPDDHGLTVLPFLAGERAPNWNADARGAILGLTLNTRPIEILRAGMEAVAYRLGLVYEMLKTVAPEVKEIVASGGALMNSPAWVQMIADVLNTPVIASAENEATSRGCALIALKSLGVIQSFGDLPASLGAAYAPDESRHQTYARAMERQERWYNLLVKEKR